LRRLGSADVTVNLLPGHIAELEYRAPVHNFPYARAALGTPPQQYRDLRAMIAIYVVLLGVGVLFFGGLFWLVALGGG
jgi:hypothetical protein